MLRMICIILLCVASSACTQIEEFTMPAHAKLNKAFPVAAAVRIAEENLRSSLQQDEAAAKVFDADYAGRLELRALTCSQGQTIGRFDSIAKVQALAVDRDCLNQQDAGLLQYLGIRQLATLVLKPPLRPLKSLGLPVAMPTGELDIYSGVAASEAGVALLRSTRSEFVSVEIPGGKKIATLPRIPDASQQVMLSPNGRVAAIEMNSRGSLTFVDVESGAILWESKEFNQIYAWIPEISAALLSGGKENTLVLADFLTGKITPYPLNIRNPSWALRISSKPSRILLGSQRGFSLIEQVRDQSGIQASIIKEFQLKQGQGVTSSAPTLMLGGKAIVFISSRDLMRIDLDSGKETFWLSGEFLANRYGKLSETTLLVDSYASSGSVKSWVLDITDATLAPVIANQSGLLSELAGRTGFMRRSSNQVWLGDKVEVGAKESFNALLGSFNLERQIAKLEAQTRIDEVNNRVAELNSRVAEGKNRMAELMKSANAENAANAAKISAYQARMSGYASPNVTTSTSSVPMLAGLARDAQVEAIGVYQGNPTENNKNGRKMGSVEVKLQRSAKPIVLLLSSYEAVSWRLVTEPGAHLAAVLVSGYYPSEVTGAGSARVISSGSIHAYKLDSPEYNALNRDAVRWTGKPISMFQGRYEGGAFSVGR